MTCLGDGEQVLGGLDDTAEVGDAADAALDGVGVVVTGGVQDVLDLVGVVLGELLVHGADIVVDTEVDGEEREEDDGLLVDDVELVADRGDGETSTGGENTDLGSDRVTGQGVEDGLRNLLGLLLGDLRSVLARGGGGREGRRDGAEGEGRAGPDGACLGVSRGNCARIMAMSGGAYPWRFLRDGRPLLRCVCGLRGEMRCYVVVVQRSEELLQVELASPRTNRLPSAIARALEGTSEDFDLELFGDADLRGKIIANLHTKCLELLQKMMRLARGRGQVTLLQNRAA